MSDRKILVYWNIKEEQKSQIRAMADKAGYTTVFTTDLEKAEAEAADAEILFGDDVRPLKKAISARWFCTDYAGVNAYLKPDVLPNDSIILSNSSGAYGVTISEHIIMVSLMMMRNFKINEDALNRADWSGRNTPMTSFYGSRITIFGTGDIGTTFASRVKIFMPASITGVNRSGRKPSGDYDAILTWDHLPDVLPKTDILVMSLPETPETVNIMNREAIALLPVNAYLVNVGRGSAIDEDALVDALNAGKIAGAALDVMRTEPLPLDSPLRTARNMLLTPHVAGQMTLGYTMQKAVDMFCEDFENYISGKKLRYEVDQKIGY